MKTLANNFHENALIFLTFTSAKALFFFNFPEWESIIFLNFIGWAVGIKIKKVNVYE